MATSLRQHRRIPHPFGRAVKYTGGATRESRTISSRYTCSPMRWLLDGLYLVAALISSPIWLFRMIRTGKIRTDWSARFGRGDPLPAGDRPRLLVHAVSVGEVNAIRALVEMLADGPGQPEVVVASTTDTGVARAREVFGGRHAVVRYPLDFSWSVSRFLDRVRPDAVALVELEVWPGFTAACARRRIPLCVVNGRLSARSARRYGWIRSLVRPGFRRLALAAVQDETYAARFRRLGTRPESVHVTGSMKWDTARIADDVPGADALARDLGIDRGRPLVVAGSTAPDEHAALHAAVPPGVQLLCAPRKPEWFDQAAADLPGCARRSRDGGGSATDRFLLDTIGELRLAYALADVVVIGRSFGSLHGSDMIEPVALGKPTIVGPAVTDFTAIVDALEHGNGLVRTDLDGLGRAITALLADPALRGRLAAAGRAVVRQQQGATARHVALIAPLFEASAPRN